MKAIKTAAKASQAAKLHKLSGGACGKAKGGSVHGPHGNRGHHGKTQVNVVVGGGGAPRPVPVPVPVGGPCAAGPIAPSRPMAPPAAPAAPMGPRPMGLKTGGKPHRANGGRIASKFNAGAGSGEGRLEKAESEKKRSK